MPNKHRGSSFDNFLQEQGILEHAEAVAIKRVLTYQIEQAMKKNKINKTVMADNMRTSRSELDRLLNPDNISVTLNTLVKAANMLNKKLNISFSEYAKNTTKKSKPKGGVNRNHAKAKDIRTKNHHKPNQI